MTKQKALNHELRQLVEKAERLGFRLIYVESGDFGQAHELGPQWFNGKGQGSATIGFQEKRDR